VPLIAPTLFRVAGLSLLIGILYLGPMAYMFEVYGRVLDSQSSTTLLWLLLILVVVLAVMESLEWVRFRLMRSLALVFELECANRAFSHTQESLSFTSGANPAPWLVNDLRQLRDVLTNPGLLALFDLPIAGLFLLFLYFLSPWLAALAASALVLQLVFGLGHARYAASLLKASGNRTFATDQALRAAVLVRPTLLAMDMAAPVVDQWRKSEQESARQADKFHSSYAATQSAMKTIQLLATSALLGVAAWRFLSNDLLGGAAMLIVASTLGTRVLAPVAAVVTNWSALVQAGLATQRVFAALGQQRQTLPSMPLPAPKGALEFQAVIGAPPPDSRNSRPKPVIKGLDFRLAPGSVLAVIGPNGAGKTAFTKLAVGLWPCLAGSVRLDGADLYAWNRERLGPNIGYLPQRVNLFQATVAANLARGAIPDPETMATILKEFDLTFIDSLGQGLNTEITDEGARLSAGQRQRLGIARAFYGSPSLVVLDEPTSRLDEQAEASLTKLIKSRSQRGCTVIFTTHSLSMLRVADQVLVLQQGEQQYFGAADRFLASLYAAGNAAPEANA
jgi:ATP-binding cassette subfamily C exporter for protease/lipase